MPQKQVGKADQNCSKIVASKHWCSIMFHQPFCWILSQGPSETCRKTSLTQGSWTPDDCQWACGPSWSNPTLLSFFGVSIFQQISYHILSHASWSRIYLCLYHSNYQLLWALLSCRLLDLLVEFNSTYTTCINLWPSVPIRYLSLPDHQRSCAAPPSTSSYCASPPLHQAGLLLRRIRMQLRLGVGMSLST